MFVPTSHGVDLLPMFDVRTTRPEDTQALQGIASCLFVLYHKMAPNAPITGQNSLNGDSGSGQRGSAGRSLANGSAADLEDGEITEDEKSTGRSTASTPTLRTFSTDQSQHETKPPPSVGGSNAGEAAATPEPSRPPTLDHDLASPRSCMHMLLLCYLF